jgi:hypothetical protein
MVDEIAQYDKNFNTTSLGYDGVSDTVANIKTNAAGDAILVEAVAIVNEYKTAISGADTTPNYLEDKIVAGSNITITKLNTGGNEQLEISSTGGTSFYQTVQESGVSETQRARLNFVDYFTATDNAGNTSTDINIDTAGLGNDSTLISTLTGNTTFLTNIANSSTFVNALAVNTEFIDALVSNAYFTTTLANDTNFIDELVANTYFLTSLANSTEFIDLLIANTYFTTTLANDTNFIDSLVANTYFTTTLANDTNFVDSLVANTYFTTTLANDTNFISELTSNATFITDITTTLSGAVSVVSDGVTITGDGTVGNPLVAVGGSIYQNNYISDFIVNKGITSGGTQYGIGEYNWINNTTAPLGVIASGLSEFGHNGVIEVTCGSPNAGSLSMGIPDAAPSVICADLVFEATLQFANLPVSPSSGSISSTIFGLVQDSSGTYGSAPKVSSIAKVAFALDSYTSTTVQVIGCASNSATQNVTSPTASFNQNEFHDFKIIFAADGTTAEFFMDNVSMGTLAIPSGSTTNKKIPSIITTNEADLYVDKAGIRYN